MNNSPYGDDSTPHLNRGWQDPESPERREWEGTNLPPLPPPPMPDYGRIGAGIRSHRYPEKRKLGVSFWILMVLIGLVLLCSAGAAFSLFAVDATVKEIDRSVKVEEVAKTEDVEITKCYADTFDYVLIDYTIVNGQGSATSYFITFEILDNKEVRVGEAYGSTTDLGPEAIKKDTAHSDAKFTKGVTCKVLKVQ